MLNHQEGLEIDLSLIFDRIKAKYHSAVIKGNRISIDSTMVRAESDQVVPVSILISPANIIFYDNKYEESHTVPVYGIKSIFKTLRDYKIGMYALTSKDTYYCSNCGRMTKVTHTDGEMCYCCGAKITSKDGKMSFTLRREEAK